jgi:hypothetical protein
VLLFVLLIEVLVFTVFGIFSRVTDFGPIFYFSYSRLHIHGGERVEIYLIIHADTKVHCEKEMQGLQ